MHPCHPFTSYPQSLSAPFILANSIPRVVGRADRSGITYRLLPTLALNTRQFSTTTYSRKLHAQRTMPGGFYDPKPYKVQPTDTERLSDVVKVSCYVRITLL